jgi:hypothetical protein
MMSLRMSLRASYAKLRAVLQTAFAIFENTERFLLTCMS